MMFISSNSMQRLSATAVVAVVVACLCVFTQTLRAQTPPALPVVSFENFGPEIRDNVRKAYADAQARPRDAEAIGRLGMTLHTYEEYESAVICYERARQLGPDEFRWVYYSAIVQAALGNHNEAAKTFKDALQRRPD